MPCETEKTQDCSSFRKEQKEITDLGVDVRIVDYSAISSIKSALQGVDTVISALFTSDGFYELNQSLITACEQAGVKRYIPSEWGSDIQEFPILGDEPKERSRDLLAGSKLEHTFVSIGLFMDFLLPTGAKRYLDDIPVPVDIQNATAEIPGTGDERITLTLADDIGDAVAELIDEPKWGKYTNIVGETTSWNQILHTAETITGKKFASNYKSQKELEEQLNATTDEDSQFLLHLQVLYAKGCVELKTKHNFKTVKFTSVAELLTKTYGKK